MSAASSSAVPDGATHMDESEFYWKNNGEGTWYLYEFGRWKKDLAPEGLHPLAVDAPSNAAAASASGAAAAAAAAAEEEEGAAEAAEAEYRGNGKEDQEQQEEYDEDEDAPVEGEDTRDTGPEWEYGQPRHTYTDSLGLSDEDGEALYAAISDGDFSEAFADALAYIGVQNPDEEAVVEGAKINSYGKIVASAFGARVEPDVSSSASREERSPPSAPRSAAPAAPRSAAPAAAGEDQSTQAGYIDMTVPEGTLPPEMANDEEEVDAAAAAAAASATPARSARVRRPPPVFGASAVRDRREGRGATSGPVSAPAAAATPASLERAASLASSAATPGSAVSAATKRTVLHRSRVEQTRLDTTNPDRWGSKSTSAAVFNEKMSLEEVCILCSCKFKERLSGNKVSGKDNIKTLKLGVEPTKAVLESFKGISLDHHLPVNFLCALVGGITAKGVYTAGQYSIFALTGDLVCWNCNYVKNDALFATLRRSPDGTFAGLKVSKPGIKGFCEKLWANENKEGQPFLPADLDAVAKNPLWKGKVKNTLQLSILRKLGEKATLEQAKKAWMAHQIPILEDRTQMLLNQIRQYAWPRRAINRLKALGIAKRAQDKITETLPAYRAASDQLKPLLKEINRLKGGDKGALKAAKDEASKLRTTMNKLKISNGTQRVLAVLAKLDKQKPVWLQDTPPTQGLKTQVGTATFVPAVEFPRGRAAARARVPEAPPAAVELINAAKAAAKAASRRPAPAAAAAAASALPAVQEAENEDEDEDEDEDEGVVREGSLEPDPEEEERSALDRSLRDIAPPQRRARTGGGFNARAWNQLQQEQHQAGSARKTQRRRGHRGTRRRRRYVEARS